ncbi:MAG: diacylglycerol kinase [Treponema sp.]|nr:diacylglycerol kinase [Treponema sp.]
MDYIFAQSLTDICGRSMVSVNRPLRCMVIVNPVAGGFTIPSRWKNNVKILNEYRQKAQANPQRQMDRNALVNLTENKGAAGKIAESLIGMAQKNPDPFYLIISAGGDGTHSEIQYALYNAPENVRSNIAVLKLPMGTGNDGSDGAHLAQALDLLISPVHIELSPAVQLTTASGGPASAKGPYLAFNILSVGLDAYVTHMTNKMKGKLPGDSYKLWLDIAALFYDRLYKVDYLDVKAFNGQNTEILSFSEKLLLMAMGASGRRSYGSQQKILPDDRNVACLKQMLLHRKLLIKGQVSKGTHTNNPEVIMLNANRLEFSGKHPILAQMDGETVLLEPGDFPASMELTKPVIPLLKLGQP